MKKNVLITGSTDGIGKLLAIKLAKEGHGVIVHGRSEEKVAHLVTELKTQSNKSDIKGFVADFSDINAVKQMAEEVKKEISHIDILINNAGVFKSSSSRNADGLDLRFTVNYLAPVALTNRLLPLLKKGNNSRIINLSSAAQSPVVYNAISGSREVSVNESYAISKLALTMWSFYLAKEQKDITVIAVNPGSLLNTKMALEAYGQHWSPADKGTNILYDLAISDKHKGMTGKYFDNDNGMYSQAHPDAYNEDAIKKLIETTNQIID